MILNNQYLIKLTFITFSVWVMPAATEPNLGELKRQCQELLKTSLEFLDIYQNIQSTIAWNGRVPPHKEKYYNEKIDKSINEMKAEIKAIEEEVNDTWMTKLTAIIYSKPSVGDDIRDNVGYVMELVLTHLEKYTQKNYFKKDYFKKDDVEKKYVSLFKKMVSGGTKGLKSVKLFLFGVSLSDMTKKIKPFCDDRITSETYITSLEEILDIRENMKKYGNHNENHEENVEAK